VLSVGFSVLSGAVCVYLRMCCVIIIKESTSTRNHIFFCVQVKRFIFSGNRMLWFVCCSVRWFNYQVRNVTTSSSMACTFHITCPRTHTSKLLIVWGRMFILRCMKTRWDPSTRRTDSRDNITDWFGLAYFFVHSVTYVTLDTSITDYNLQHIL